ncbi:hypothetical protein SCHPADRAFT_203646 [Schizopora paradoxa]|uniref:Uncharacterized protein n=1 Tax=Schizopora paradoxa TaxID=27342 RepID=A0A0H2SI04_9AGAM|nr:hypothetical protein SCHPADRAFT_203646 [Schizopora paradoxa]
MSGPVDVTNGPQADHPIGSVTSTASEEIYTRSPQLGHSIDVENTVEQIRVVRRGTASSDWHEPNPISHSKTTLFPFQLVKSTFFSRKISNAPSSSDDTDERTLRELCNKLLGYAWSGTPSARIGALEGIIALSVEDPATRATLRDCEQNRRLTETPIGANANPDVVEWTSRALFALEDNHVHDIWSRIIASPVNREELQILSDDRVAETDGRLAELSRSLKYVSSPMSFRNYVDTLEIGILNRHTSRLDISNAQENLQGKLQSPVVHRRKHWNQILSRVFLRLRLSRLAPASSTEPTIQKICLP